MPPRSLWTGTISFGLVNVRYRDSYRDTLCEIIEAKRKGKGRPRRARPRGERAKKADIPGRAKMSKDELVDALRTAA